MQRDATGQNPESGEEVAKQSHLLTSKAKGTFSKFSPSYWLSRVFQRKYQRGDEEVVIKEWCVRIQARSDRKGGSERREINLATNNREEAARKAARLFMTLRTKGWDAALAEFRPAEANRPRSGTVGEFIGIVRGLTGVRDRTFENYAYALRKIAAEATGAKDVTKARFNPKTHEWRNRVDSIPLDKLTPRAVEAWKSECIQAAGKNPIENQRARRNVNSFIRNARSLFSRRILKRLTEPSIPFPVPDPLPFQGVEMERAGSTRYVSTIDAGRLLKAGRAELSKEDPEAWKVVLLALGAGLRRAEIDGLCKTQIDFDRMCIRIVNHEHFEAKTEDSEGEVYVDRGLLAELRPLLSESSLFVVEPGTAPKPERKGQFYRCDATFNRATAWLRAQGVLTDKPLHALRKEFGSIIAGQADIHTASRQLRHANISTTAAYYTDHRRRSTVGVGDMLKGKVKAT